MTLSVHCVMCAILKILLCSRKERTGGRQDNRQHILRDEPPSLCTHACMHLCARTCPDVDVFVSAVQLVFALGSRALCVAEPMRYLSCHLAKNIQQIAAVRDIFDCNASLGIGLELLQRTYLAHHSCARATPKRCAAFCPRLSFSCAQFSVEVIFQLYFSCAS